MKNVYFLLMLMSLTQFNVFSQPPSGRPNPGNTEGNALITGKVIDSNTGQPVEYASIGLYRMRDSSLVAGVVTDVEGNFSVKDLSFGRFYAEISFMGYKKSRITGINLSPNQSKAALGTVKLNPSTTEIKAVEVVGERNQMEYKIDKKVINVSQQVVASGGSAIDVLENTPSVQTDIEGNVQLRGSSNFTVLIDGKPTALKGSEALQQLPASAIQNIEIITNPSAKYDPDGTAGIINVLMKKQKTKGANGIINLSAGTGNKYSGDFLVNYRNSKFNYFLGGDFNEMNFKMSGSSEERALSSGLDTIFKIDHSEGKMKRSGKGIKAGFDYYINDKNTLSLSGNYSQRSFGRSNENKHHEYTVPADTDIYYLYDNNMRGPHDNFSGNLDYRLKFDESDHQLLASFYYENGTSDHPSDMNYIYTDNNWNPLSNTIKQKTQEGEQEGEYRAKLDYTRPIGKGKLEIGYQGRLETAKSDYHFYNISEIGGTETKTEDMNQYNEIDFKDHIEALYTTFSNSMKLFDYQLGLRVEYTDRNLKNKISGEGHPVEELGLFPTLHLSKQLPWGLQVQTSYSRRINRPRGRELDPFVQYMDKRNVRRGNPDLKSELTDSYELNLQKKIGESVFSIEGYYRQTNNLISDIKIFNPDDSITTNTVANFKRDYSVGGEAMLDIPITKWWNFNITSSVFKYHIDGSKEDSTAARNTVTMNARANSTIRLKWGMQIQANYFYNAPSVTPQGTREGYSFTTIGIRQDLLKKKASLTLQVRDLFGTMKFNSTTEYAGYYSYDRRKRESPIFTLTFTYRINNYKQQARSDRNERENGSVNESEFNGGME
jgi:outer membrane receptor protein involved in Fe transport